jgi:leucyl aminopeptidase
MMQIARPRVTTEDADSRSLFFFSQNMISPKAYVPSDVLTASNGKTIEVYNTDAEGRLTLADALVYADKTVGCEKIIELSTLTGSCIISLGKQIAGVWTDSDELAQELNLISKATGDKCWRMPMAKEYNEQIESLIADLKNCGTRYGGSITAALFLQNFVDPQKPFAHIDMAGELEKTNVEHVKYFFVQSFLLIFLFLMTHTQQARTGMKRRALLALA